MAELRTASQFRKILRRALFLTQAEGTLFDQLPDSILEGIFRHNFNGNLAMAERVLLNRYKRVDEVDRARLEQEKRNITNLSRAARQIAKDLESGRDILFITDNDNDGSLSQAILIEFLKTLPEDMRRRVHVEYAQPIGTTRGFNLEVVDLACEARGWATDHPYTIVTADNGINSRNEQQRIAERYPRSTLVVTDHHLPVDGLVVEEDERSIIVNPKYRPSEYFKTKNISGANTLGVLLDQVVGLVVEAAGPGGLVRETVDGEGVARPEPVGADAVPLRISQALANMAEIGSWANLLDYANADMADMPTRPYIIEKALGLRPLLNVSNSMSNLITGRFTEEDVKEVLDAAPGLDPGRVRGALAEVQTLNTVARKLLGLYHEHLGQGNTAKDEKDFYAELSHALVEPGFSFTSINPNYIEQLRPAIFNLAAIDNKDLFMTLAADTMVEVYKQLRQVERDILGALREVGLLRQDRRANSTILYPVDKSVTKLFNRRLLGKAYNQDNNGFLLILSDFQGTAVKGSMRSLYPIGQIMEGKEEIEARLGIQVDFQGHDMAAGFFVESTNGEDMTEERLAGLNAWIDDRISQIKAAERINQMPNLELDFASVGLANKINTLIKANLAGMWGLPAVLRFSPNKGEEVFITDPETTEQISLSEVVKRKSFGYQAIATDFGGGAIVVPVELLRTIVESGYSKGLRLSYMDEGVFMGSQVVEVDSMPNLVPFKGGRTDQEDLVKYYQETYRNSHFVPLSREDFRNSPYFRYNKYGEQEFHRWESVVIGMLDATGRDVLAVVDTEGTGLGKAPKCFNIGGTNISINPTSGKILDSAAFERGYFRDGQGNEFLLDEEQVASLVPLEDHEEAESIRGNAVILHKMSLSSGFGFSERYAYAGTRQELEPVHNMKFDPENDEVIYNRTINGFAFSFLVNNRDFAITKEFENLTGIGNWMVEKLGRSAAAVDRALVEHYSQLKDMDGKPAKIIFQAHNMPYDKGVIAANFQRLNAMMDEHMTSDTAKLARQAKLAYDDTPVSSFDGIAGLPPKAYFYDSPFSDYSLSTFLARCEQGKGGVFPDTTAKILLRFSPDTGRFSIIDRKANREVELACSLEDLMKRRQPGQLPNNAVRYSVERLSSRAMIRNIILLDKPKPAKVELLPHEAPYRAALEAFQDNYHFDVAPQDNIDHFVTSLFRNDRDTDLMADVDLGDLTSRFLEENRELQARFHDGWIYEKVLAHYEPVGKGRITDDVVEQINYYTDLPNNKIREVLDKVVAFREHFGIEHALIHEQHNNIRQSSEDGQGLSDTAYESVLPMMLAMMKFYNPYYQSVTPAVEALVDANIKGSLIQHMLGEDYNNELARDSYSVKQMLAFNRQSNTAVVKAAKAMARGLDSSDGRPALVRFNLTGEILPPGSALYGQPRTHLGQEEVAQAAEELTFVLVNEQIKSSIRLSKSLDPDHCRRLMQATEANEARCLELRERLLEKFETITFSRKDAEIKKVSDMMRDVFSGAPAKLPRGFKATAEQADTARAMIESFCSIFEKMGIEPNVDEATRLAEMIEHNVAIQAEAARDARAAGEVDDQDDAIDCGRFLPEIDIIRREPMKFAIKHFGLQAFYAAVRANAEAEAEPAPVAVSVEKAPATKKSRRRAPAA